MAHDLIIQYIDAVTYYLPAKILTDVEKELNSLIIERLAERCGHHKATEADITAVLSELGTPEELAVKYSVDEQKALISGIYYLVYKKILRIVLPIAIIVSNVAGVITWLTEQTPSQDTFSFIVTLLLRIVRQTVSITVLIFALITIIFAFLERKKVTFNNGDVIFSLPSVPLQASIRPFGPIFSIIWQLFITALLLSSQYSHTWQLLIGIWLVCGLSYGIARLIIGRYTKRLAIAAFITHLIEGIVATVCFANAVMTHTALMSKISLELSSGDSPNLLRNISAIILGVILLVLVIEVAVAVFKAWKYDR